MIDQAPDPSPAAWRIGKHTLASRLIVGSGRYDNSRQMARSIAASGADCVTVAVRREKLHDKTGANILDSLPVDRLTLLPNTAGCYTAADAVRAARLGREILRTLGNAGADWVKLEVLGDSRTLLPDPAETVLACQKLVAEGFTVLAYTSDCPVTAARLQSVGAAAVMPAGSPIGSGQGILNPSNIRIILETLKSEDADFPVIIDAGVGTASDAAIAMELGADGVLLNTAIAHAADPIAMAIAMRHAVLAGYLAARAGRIPRRLYATASSPVEGVISTRPHGSLDHHSHDAVAS